MKPWKPIKPDIPVSLNAVPAVTRFLAIKYMVGSRKVTPMTRPHRRWPHSIQYIFLNSSSVIPGLSRVNSGDDLYFENSDSQSTAEAGGIEPVTGRHSVMLKLCETLDTGSFQSAVNIHYPDSVSRVSPPNTTIPKTLTALPRSQYPTALPLVAGKGLL